MERFLAGLADTMARRRRLVAALWLLLVLAAAPFAAQQTERLSGGGWDVPGSSSVAVRDALEDVPGRGGAALGLFVEGEPNVTSRELSRAQLLVGRHPEVDFAGPVRSFSGGRALFQPLRYVGPRGEMYDFAGDLRKEVVRDVAGARTRVVGEIAMWSNFQDVSKEQLAQAETIGFPFIVLILLAAFGTIVAASMPIVIAVAAVLVTGAVTWLAAGAFEISIYVTNMATMIGIGVAVDYSLFVVGRYRRALREGRDVPAALREALASAGTAVVFSGATVVASLASLLLVDVNAMRSMALGAIWVVATAVVATVTLLPALLAFVGTRIERLRVRIPGTRRSGAPRDEFWRAWSARVMRRPGVALVAGTVALLVLASPLLDIEPGSGALDQLPADAEVRVATERLSAVAGPGVTAPIDALAPNERVAEAMAERAPDVPGVAASREPVRVRDAYLVQIVLESPPESDPARATLATLRAEWGDEGVRFGGVTAFSQDLDDAIFGGLWQIALFILLCSYVILLLLLRSVLLPLKAVLMNLLSVGAAYGVLVAVFQWGWLDWTGYDSPGYIDTIVPVMLLAITFGLSMDYEVFLLTRIRERYLATGDNERAVGEGLARSGRTITAAALIMVAVFGSFGIAGATSLKELGIGLAVAIAVDATVVRLVLVPAAMRLLGEWNWWLPTWLG
ncbi:MAG TPA: MMPL family transporter, partial [Gaiellaceae bacterium]|nr:MMPL family transporter [Gaiellaceae bacterium]